MESGAAKRSDGVETGPGFSGGVTFLCTLQAVSSRGRAGTKVEPQIFTDLARGASP